ncbi:MAG TPA: N-acyl homoserine lactonase family protein [Roseiarcus sp.]|jgi:glyoxylase-like metal-dependent hydrolase (beta-lactamase superfamily II)|nr:N-acyl homoserine lactonase family protein [Roseiarcus sp.]
MRVHAIETGRVQIKASQIAGRGHGLARRVAPLIDGEWSDWLPTSAFAIEHQDGVILVDAGASAGLMRLPRWHPYFRLAVRFDIESDQEVGPQLRAIGIGAADVKRIVLTHMHIDHDGGLAAFPSSEILVSPGELKTASGLAGRLRGYLPERWPKSFDPEPLCLEGAYGAFARSRRLTSDGAVVAVATSGHTRDHISVIVEDGEAALFIAGDASYTEEAMLSGRIDGVGADESAELATLAAIRAFAASRPTIYLPAHDPEAAKRLAQRRVTKVLELLTGRADAPARQC